MDGPWVVQSVTRGRLAGLAARPVRISRLLLAVVAVCCAVLVRVGRGDDNPIYLVALLITVALVILGTQNVLRARLRLRPVVAGKRTHLRLMGPRDVAAFNATIDASVEAENRWDSTVRDEYLSAIRRSSLPSTYAICTRRTGEIVGVVDVAAVGELAAELGAWIGPRHRGLGYMSDALAAVVDFLDGSGCTSIRASTAQTNIPMQSALRRAGFVEQDPYTHQFANGETVPAIRFTYALDDGAQRD